MITRKFTIHFLQSVKTTNGSYLLTLEGQTLKGKKVSPGITVKGCETYRKKFPPGTYFATTTLVYTTIRKFWCYKVKDLYSIGPTMDSFETESQKLTAQLIQAQTEKTKNS